MNSDELAAEEGKAHNLCAQLRDICAGNGDPPLIVFSRRRSNDIKPSSRQANSHDQDSSANLSAASVPSGMSSDMDSESGSTASLPQKALHPMRNLFLWEAVSSAEPPAHRTQMENSQLCAELDRKLEASEPLEFSEENLLEFDIKLGAGCRHYYVQSGDTTFQTRNIDFWNNFDALVVYL